MVACADAEATRARKRVPQFVQHDAAQNHQDKEDPEEGPRHVYGFIHPSGDGKMNPPTAEK